MFILPERFKEVPAYSLCGCIWGFLETLYFEGREEKLKKQIFIPGRRSELSHESARFCVLNARKKTS